MFKCWFVEKKEKEQDKDITDKKSEKAKKNLKKIKVDARQSHSENFQVFL